MLLFLLLVFPAVLTAYCFYSRTRQNVPLVFIGLVCGLLVCGFKALFLFSHRIIPANFMSNFWYYLLNYSLIPVVVIYGLFFVFSKDEVEYKVNAFLPLFLSFYMIYLPYLVITHTDSVYSGFTIFVEPVIYAMMIFQLGLFARKIYKNIKESKVPAIVCDVFVVLFSIIVPALIQSIYTMNTGLIFEVICLAIYAAFMLFTAGLSFIIHKN